LIDAAAQQGALAAHISLFIYMRASRPRRSRSKSIAARAKPKCSNAFTEAIIDTLPVSLYAIDRDHRIVAWNRNRELGELGVPRGKCSGRAFMTCSQSRSANCSKTNSQSLCDR
jgi:hypothetical protein